MVKDTQPLEVTWIHLKPLLCLNDRVSESEEGKKSGKKSSR